MKSSLCRTKFTRRTSHLKGARSRPKWKRTEWGKKCAIMRWRCKSYGTKLEPMRETWPTFSEWAVSTQGRHLQCTITRTVAPLIGAILSASVSAIIAVRNQTKLNYPTEEATREAVFSALSVLFPKLSTIKAHRETLSTLELTSAVAISIWASLDQGSLRRWVRMTGPSRCSLRATDSPKHKKWAPLPCIFNSTLKMRTKSLTHRQSSSNSSSIMTQMNSRIPPNIGQCLIAKLQLPRKRNSEIVMSVIILQSPVNLSRAYSIKTILVASRTKISSSKARWNLSWPGTP